MSAAYSDPVHLCSNFNVVSARHEITRLGDIFDKHKQKREFIAPFDQRWACETLTGRQFNEDPVLGDHVKPVWRKVAGMVHWTTTKMWYLSTGNDVASTIKVAAENGLDNIAMRNMLDNLLREYNKVCFAWRWDAVHNNQACYIYDVA